MKIQFFYSFPLRLFASFALMGAALSSATPSQAEVIFFDNFDLNDPGFNVVPTGWALGNSGNVDLIGVCNGKPPFFDFKPGNGCYVNLDGPTNAPGLLKKSFTLLAGNSYILEFDLGSIASNIVDVALGTATAQYSLVSNQPFSKRSLSFVPATTGVYDISFLNQGNDNNGALLNNVKLSDAFAVPAPLPLWGSFAAFSAQRRLRILSRQLRA